MALPTNRMPNFERPLSLSLLAQLQEVETQLGKKVVRENGPG